MADILIGSEQWVQPQIIEISESSNGYYTFRFCREIERKTCRYLGKEGQGYSKGQLQWIKMSLDQKVTLVNRNKPLILSVALLGTVGSLGSGAVVGSSIFIATTDLTKKIFSDSSWQASYYQDLKKSFRLKNGEFYVPDIEELARSIYEILETVPAYEVTCECNVLARNREFQTMVMGHGRNGAWDAKLNAEYACRSESEQKLGQFAAPIELKCSLVKSPSQQRSCTTEEFCS